MAKLYFYYSAMNAGKSTSLLQSAFNYRERGMNTIIYSSIIDDRYQIGYVTSRLGINSPAVVFDTKFDFFEDVKSRIKNNTVQCVFVDEAQFLKKVQVRQLCRIVDELDIPVLTYGLRSDFKGEPFEGSIYLLTWADKNQELKTVCHCGKKATMNMRIAEDGSVCEEGDQIAIGGNELYISTCRKHFYEKKPGVIKDVGRNFTYII
ncbi:thymidine kinase [Piromyces finnis]|uniref:Thymidine kinase n=1 Tax=Piromyces finnis TaxID=1754191 RepID=A0A1Y1UZL1_9FUNG|nr:thymidine kinase [Piromyces finnis]|eukprot:ORX44144.1 thymidine kinase [Piromyces finnis]